MNPLRRFRGLGPLLTCSLTARTSVSPGVQLWPSTRIPRSWLEEARRLPVHLTTSVWIGIFPCRCLRPSFLSATTADLGSLDNVALRAV